MAESIRFYFDQHVWKSVARGLRQRGVEVLTAQAAGRCGLPDVDQLGFAAERARVVVTFDADYLALHRSGMRHAGVAWCPEQKYSVGQLIEILATLHGVMTPDDMRDHVEYL